MAPDPVIPDPATPPVQKRDALRGRDWVVAIGIGALLLLIVAAIFRNGLAYLYG